MDWQFAIGLCCWCFIAGMIIGERMAKAGNPVIDFMRPRIKEIESQTFFTGLSVCNWSTWIVDGKQYRLTLEREQDARLRDRILDQLAAQSGKDEA